MYYRDEADWQKELIAKISKDLNLDRRVVREIAYYPLLFLRRHIIDDVCERPVRIRKLGVWTLRGNRGKKKVLRQKVDFLKDHSDKLYDIFYTTKKKPFASKEEFESYMEYLYRVQSHGIVRALYSKAQELL